MMSQSWKRSQSRKGLSQGGVLVKEKVSVKEASVKKEVSVKEVSIEEVVSVKKEVSV